MSKKQVRSVRLGSILAFTAPLLVCFLALVCMSCLEKKQAFPVEAKVKIGDDFFLEITDVALIGRRSHKREGPYEVGLARYDIDIPIHIDGAWWRELAISEIDLMVLESIRVGEDLWEWLSVSIKTKAGDEMAGRIPVEPDLTWYCAWGFGVLGHSTVQGRVPDFKIRFNELRRIEAKDESWWILTDKNGETYDVWDLRFVMYIGAPLYRRSVFWNTRKGSPGLLVKVGDIETSLSLYTIERLRITPFNRQLSFHAVTRDGWDWSGVTRDDLLYLFGHTKDGRTWFKPLVEETEIEFAALPRKYWDSHIKDDMKSLGRLKDHNP